MNKSKFLWIEEHVVGDKNTSPLFATFPKADEHASLLVQPPNTDDEIDENDLPVRWSMKK